ncbi:MAG: hypothetical protein WD928_12960, partial [Gammaproteobacteria bacterium]
NVQRVEQLLQTFVLRNGRLPCPALPDLRPDEGGYGVERWDGTECGSDLETFSEGGSQIALYAGTLPAYTLNRRMAMMTDGWDNQFRYVVVSRATTINAFKNGFPVFEPYRIQLVDKPAGTGSDVTVVEDGIAAIVSAGPNRNGGYTLDGAELPQPPAGAVDERGNLELDSPIVSAPYSEDSTAPFDDIVQVWNEDNLLAGMDEIASKHALTRERMQRMVDLIYGWVILEWDEGREMLQCASDLDGEPNAVDWPECLFPFAAFLPAEVETLDGWGTPIFYLPYYLHIQYEDAADEPGDILFEIRSGGPDGNRSELTTDNLVIKHTRAEVIARLAAAGIAVGE